MRMLFLTPIALSMIAAATAALAEDADLEFFEKKIRPVLAKECYECHSAGAKKLKGGLYLDTAAGMLKGGDSVALSAIKDAGITRPPHWQRSHQQASLHSPHQQASC